MQSRRSGEQPTGYAAGRLTARPHRAAKTAAVGPGDHPAPTGASWGGVLFVPASYRPDQAAPLLVALHGATGRGERMLNRWRETADAAGLVVLAPDSEAQTWDVLVEGFGSDVARLDRALADIFARVEVDPRRVIIGGFSDGASYALSLGLANGDLFTHVVANSPGFCWPPSLVGKPRLLVTHGTEDQVLPIQRTSRLHVPQLQNAGYDVAYHEFAGGHQLTPETMQLSLRWAGVLAPEA